MVLKSAVFLVVVFFGFGREEERERERRNEVERRATARKKKKKKTVTSLNSRTWESPPRSLTFQLPCLSTVGKSNGNHKDAENRAERHHTVVTRPKEMRNWREHCQPRWRPCLKEKRKEGEKRTSRQRVPSRYFLPKFCLGPEIDANYWLQG